MIDRKLVQYCKTPRQTEIVEAVLRSNGSFSAAARLLEVDESTVRKSVKSVTAEAARRLHSPEHSLPAGGPPGFYGKRISQHLDKSGAVDHQWNIFEADKQQQYELMVEAINSLAEGIKPVEPVSVPKHLNSDLMCVYPMGDPHVGMYAWCKEAGENFDVNIARRDLHGAMSYLASNTPATDTALILNLGDFFHADNKSNTTTSGTPVDVDGRFSQVLELGMLAMVDTIDIARKKHKKVIVHNTIGNHDTHLAPMLAIALKAWYREEPRVEIRDTASIHHYEQFGKVLIGVTHGHTIKKGAVGLDAVMATDRPQMWGQATKRYWYTGHIHSTNRAELTGCTWESFRNLPPNDAWHQGQGYRSGRDMCAIVHHKDHGEVARVTCDISIARNAG
jgi:hypothetical protein